MPSIQEIADEAMATSALEIRPPEIQRRPDMVRVVNQTYDPRTIDVGSGTMVKRARIDPGAAFEVPRLWGTKFKRQHGKVADPIYGMWRTHSGIPIYCSDEEYRARQKAVLAAGGDPNDWEQCVEPRLIEERAAAERAKVPTPVHVTMAANPSIDAQMAKMAEMETSLKAQMAQFASMQASFSSAQKNAAKGGKKTKPGS